MIDDLQQFRIKAQENPEYQKLEFRIGDEVTVKDITRGNVDCVISDILQLYDLDMKPKLIVIVENNKEYKGGRKVDDIKNIKLRV